VYELRDQSWHDRGTGQCKGLYDDSQDLALLVVEAEDITGDKDGEGGFLKDELLLSTKVEKEDIYARQQGGSLVKIQRSLRSWLTVPDTLIVWTEPNGLDVALSFQDADGCEDIWNFILEVQRHLNNMPGEL
jgi:protein phosphatase-4 regulatory subunit 3